MLLTGEFRFKIKTAFPVIARFLAYFCKVQTCQIPQLCGPGSITHTHAPLPYIWKSKYIFTYDIFIYIHMFLYICIHWFYITGEF